MNYRLNAQKIDNVLKSDTIFIEYLASKSKLFQKSKSGKQFTFSIDLGTEYYKRFLFSPYLNGAIEVWSKKKYKKLSKNNSVSYKYLVKNIAKVLKKNIDLKKVIFIVEGSSKNKNEVKLTPVKSVDQHIYNVDII